MRLKAWVLTVAPLCTAMEVAAQEPPGRVRPLQLPIEGLEPAAVVARLAREAMHAPTDSATWAALADALPELALTGTADLEGTFDAARMADSISAAARAAPAGAGHSSPEATAWTAAAPRAVRALARTQVRAMAADPENLGLASALMLSALLGGLVARRRRQASAPRPRRASTPAGRRWTAATLASGGVAVPEIARRIGLAQEGVDLVLRLAACDTSGAPRLLSAPRPRRAPAASTSTVAAQARLEREILGGAGRLRDRRLTYGGGVR